MSNSKEAYVPHTNEGTPDAHAFYVAGRPDDKRGRLYVYCMTAHHATVDSFIGDIRMAIPFKSPEDFESKKRHYPGLRELQLWKVGVIDS